MANPTSNFGWQMPTPTDLVTDLPADFEVFGQAVDTSMADLKGGTTDQVLAKNSNTDMDFKWVTSDDANAIQNAIVDAKGDLIGATANDTPARLAVGANGTMLVANSAESTGLKWTTATDQFPWQAWSPSYTNLTIGNGTVVARYQQIGKLVNVYYRLVFGSTTSFTSYPLISTPVTAAQSDLLFSGTSMLADASAGTIFSGLVWSELGGNAFQPLMNRVDSTYSYVAFLTANTLPMTWTTSDVMLMRYTYEAA
jgi:hypothetical protein